MRKFARKDRKEIKIDPEVRNLGNINDNEPLGVIHVIGEGLSCYKGKNKCGYEDVLSVKKDLWAK